MSTGRPHRHAIAQASMAFVTLLLLSGAVYAGLWTVDFAGTPGADPISLLSSRDSTNTLTNLGEVMVAILGIAITVVAIIVELAANRYTPRITELFLKDTVNSVFLAFFAFTAILVLWVDLSLYGPHHPTTMVIALTIAMTISMVALLPYFIYVFDFLTPTAVVAHIQFRCIDAMSRASRRPRSVDASRNEVRTGVEQLGDIALNSLDKKDKAIAVSALNALAEVGQASLEMHAKLPAVWFDTESLHSAGDQDFVALHPDIIRQLAERQTWVQMKILRQFQSLFGQSVNRMRDLCHLVAIHTRHIAEDALRTKNGHALYLSMRFMNTYLRAAINANDIRTAYNLFNEYRALAESLMRAEENDLTLQMAEWAKFYGQIAFQRNQAFILETVAYDLCTLLEESHIEKADCHDALLNVFLDVDREPEGGKELQEQSLRGVRKAQIKLATYYLVADAQKYARRIYEDMRSEKQDRLMSIRSELLAIVDPEYWEVSDRGINFDYLGPDRRAMLDEFFSWFEHLDGDEWKSRSAALTIPPTILPSTDQSLAGD